MMKERLRQAISGIAYTRIENRGKLPLFEKFLLPILGLGSLVYRFLLFTRCKLYEWNVVSSVRLPVPVLSVGNITWGGNGKTPMVEYLARCILHADICPLILTRGYGGGDETRLLQSHLCHTPALIGVGRDRTETAAKLFRYHQAMSPRDLHRLGGKFGAYKELGKMSPLLRCKKSVINDGTLLMDQDEGRKSIGVVILDDGMQHWRVIRDIEILMVNAVTLFGNGELIPYGPLRESLDALHRADIVVIHNASLVTDQQVELIMHRLKFLLSPDTPVVCSQMVPHFFLRVSNTPLNLKEIISDWLPEKLVELEAIKDATVLCISGIGCPECFFLTIKQLGAAYIDRIDFADHHKFTKKDLVKVQRKVNDLCGKWSRTFVVLTEKDYARSWEIFVGLHGVDVLVLHSTLEIMKNSGDLDTFNALISKKLLCWDPLVK